ncbi:MAG: RluA family pseudouridine synthase [Dehalococcoidia bacterium]|nr:RluA family pseudouridine synthase [Dehalococcoidia bacterium]
MDTLQDRQRETDAIAVPSSDTRSFSVATQGERLDRFLAAQCPDLSRSRVQQLIEAGHVTVNGRPVKAAHKLKPGDDVSMSVPPPAPVLGLSPEDIPLTVVYEDADLLVVDKPAGLTVHPAPGHPSGTLVNALLARVPDLGGVGGELRPGIVHRLDKDTSGLIVVAKHERALRHLQAQFKERQVRKVYLALVHRRVQPPEGVIDAPIGRDPRNRKRMAVVPDGRAALTRYRVLRYLPDYTLLEAAPATGRTHQIRVHLAHIGHPLAGDPLYGGTTKLVARQFLHAHRLTFRLPSGEERTFISPLPDDLERVLREVAQIKDSKELYDVHN